jgi:hypothetical protein
MINKSYQTSSGRKARIVCTDRSGFGEKLPIIALIKNDSGDEIAVPYSKDLRLYNSIHFSKNEDLSLVEI